MNYLTYVYVGGGDTAKKPPSAPQVVPVWKSHDRQRGWEVQLPPPGADLQPRRHVQNAGAGEGDKDAARWARRSRGHPERVRP